MCKVTATISVDYRISNRVEAAQREACRNWRSFWKAPSGCWCKNRELRVFENSEFFFTYGLKYSNAPMSGTLPDFCRIILWDDNHNY